MTGSSIIVYGIPINFENYNSIDKIWKILLHIILGDVYVVSHLKRLITNVEQFLHIDIEYLAKYLKNLAPPGTVDVTKANKLNPFI